MSEPTTIAADRPAGVHPSNLTSAILHIKALSSEVAVMYSEHTCQWYLSAPHVHLTDGSLLTSPSVHRDSPDHAVVAYLHELRDEGQGRSVVAVTHPERRHYRWNGAAFAEVPNHLLPWNEESDD